VRREVPFSHDFLDHLVSDGATLLGALPERQDLPEALVAAIGHAIGKLSERQRDVLIARFWNGMSFRAIQQTLGHGSVSTTYRLYRTALDRLRKTLSDGEEGLDDENDS
jgi:DNA-directed RNA polymerase specialized sigma24 family protein